VTQVWINGTRVSPEEARVSVFDRGFLFGDGVFEVLRAYAGKPFALEEHLMRLEHSLEVMEIASPCSRAELVDEIQQAVAGLEEDAYLRLTITRGEGLGLDPRGARTPTRVMIVAKVQHDEALLAQGVSVASVRAVRATDASFAIGAKVSAYVPNLLALMSAQRRGAYEAALVGDDGSISEGASSNLFLVTRGVLTTPPLESEILPGITRRIVLECAQELGIPIRESLVFQYDVSGADEMFLTSSVREIVPVIAFDGRSVGLGLPGRITQALHHRYRERVRTQR
jgi:branched-chain amino acid aminotransferase